MFTTSSYVSSTWLRISKCITKMTQHIAIQEINAAYCQMKPKIREDYLQIKPKGFNFIREDFSMVVRNYWPIGPVCVKVPRVLLMDVMPAYTPKKGKLIRGLEYKHKKLNLARQRRKNLTTGIQYA